MYYTNLFISLLLITCLSACSGNTEQKNNNVNTSTQNKESLKVELALYKQAILALNEKKLDQAEKLFTEMSELQPDIAGPWANLALISIKKDNPKQAQQYIDTALQKNPTMPQALNLAGDLALKDNRIKDAKKYFEQAIANKSDYALTHYNLVLIFDIYYQDIPQAITHYQLYLQYTKQPDEATERWLKGLKSTVGNNS